MSQNSLTDPDHGWLYQLFGRLKPGVEVVQAQASLDVLGQRLAKKGTGSETPELRIYLTSGFGPEHARICLPRSNTCRSPWQLMVEALLLSLLGTVLGLGLALGLTSGLEGAALGNLLPELTDLSIDGRALAFTVALTLLMAVGFGLLPGLWVSRPQLIDLVRQASPSRAGTRLWLQEVFVVGQTAAAVVLIVCTGRRSGHCVAL